MQKGISTLTVIIIIIAIAIVAVGGVFAYQYYTAKFEARNPKSETNSNVQNPNAQIAGWKTYTNTQYGFEIKFPQNLVAEEKGLVYATILMNKKETQKLSEFSSVTIKDIPFAVNPNYERAKKIFTVVVQPLEACDLFKQYGSNPIKINNITFNIRSGAWEKVSPMGEPEWQSGKAYDVVYNNVCYSILLGIDGSDNPIPNYDFKTEQLSLEKIAESFKFTK